MSTSTWSTPWNQLAYQNSPRSNKKKLQDFSGPQKPQKSSRKKVCSDTTTDFLRPQKWNQIDFDLYKRVSLKHSKPFVSTSRVVNTIFEFVFPSTHRCAKQFLLLRNVWKTVVKCFPVCKSAKNAFPVLVLAGKILLFVIELIKLIILENCNTLHLSYK